MKMLNKSFIFISTQEAIKVSLFIIINHINYKLN